MNKAQEDYIKEIYNISRSGSQKVTTKLIARALNVSDAAATDMLKKLKSLGLVNYEKYKGVTLKKKGEKLALNILRRHRLWESFLSKTLNIPTYNLHREAEILEHCASPYLIEKIDEYLNYPKFDPHGHPIPDSNGNINEKNSNIPLTESEKGKEYIVTSINDKIYDLMKYLNSIGLKINSRLKVIDKINFDASVIVLFKKNKMNFSEIISKNILVEETKR